MAVGYIQRGVWLRLLGRTVVSSFLAGCMSQHYKDCHIPPFTHNYLIRLEDLSLACICDHRYLSPETRKAISPGPCFGGIGVIGAVITC